MIKISNLLMKYNDKPVLKIPSFEFKDGVRYALIGANGSGKSTLLKIISGVIKPNDGKVEFTPQKPKISYAPQQTFPFSLSVIKNLTIVRNDKETAKSYLRRLDIIRYEKKNAAKLSGGETQKVALARVLMAEASLILLDEPTAAMDVNSAIEAEAIIDEEVKKRGATLIFATHSVSEAERLSDYVVFMKNGEIAEIKPSAEFTKSAETAEAKSFLAHL